MVNTYYLDVFCGGGVVGDNGCISCEFSCSSMIISSGEPKNWKSLLLLNYFKTTEQNGIISKITFR